MANEIEGGITSVETEAEITPVKEGETVDWESRAKELEQKAIASRERRKAEKADHEQKLKEYENKLKGFENSQPPNGGKAQSGEPDYARLAFLNSIGVNHPDDQKEVIDEAERLKLPLTDVLGMEHVKARIEAARSQRDSQAAMPRGTGRTGTMTKDSVEYYIEHPDIVPEDLELHNKVIDAKLKKIEDSSKFSATPFIG